MPQIAFVEAYYDSVTGSQQSMLPLLTETTAYDPTLVVPAEGSLTVEAERQGVAVDIVPFSQELDRSGDELLSKNPWSLLKTTTSVASYQRDVFDYLRHASYDIVYCNCLKSVILFGPVATLLDIPVIWYVRIDGPTSILDTVGSQLADHIITISDGTKRRFDTTLLQNPNPTTIYTGIDTSEQSPDRVSNHTFPFCDRDGPIICEVASIVPRKGQHDLIEAVGQVSESLGDFELVFAGEVSDEGYKHGAAYKQTLSQRIEQAGIGDRTTFLGWCDHITALLSEIDVFVLPSYNEGLPRSILEAFAMEVPVVATPAGGTREIVTDGETGIIVSKRSPEELAAAIKRLGTDPDRRTQMGKQARKTVIERFSIERYINDFEQLVFEDVLPQCDRDS